MFRRALTFLGQTGINMNRLPRPTRRDSSSRARAGKSGPSGPTGAGRGLAMGLLEAGVASGGLSVLGDLLAQGLTSPSGFDVRYRSNGVVCVCKRLAQGRSEGVVAHCCHAASRSIHQSAM